MSRDENFSDIPDLGPADEDRFKQSIPTLETRQTVEQRPLSGAASQQHVEKKGSNPLLWFLVLLLAAGLGFSLFQQFMQKQQMGASEEILLQTQSRLADIESLVNATDESSSKTGAAFLAQLKRQQNDREARMSHVDDEIRKLWAVYQKYKPIVASLEQSALDNSNSIATQGKQLDTQQELIAGQQKELKTVGGSLDSLGVALNQHKESLTKSQKLSKDANAKVIAEIVAIRNEQRLQNLQHQETNDLQEAEISDLKSKLSQGDQTQKLQATLDEHQRSINSINSSRRQTNAEILKLRNQLGRLQAPATP